MVGTHLLDWLHLGLRWLHVIAGIVWIGTSFYFVWLNNHVRRSEQQPPGSEAELWAVHGGGFYRVLKYATPPGLPGTLHWFKWEAYTTWLSGFSLLVLLFYFDAPVFLIDPSKADLSSLVAASIGVGVLVAGWLVYDLICKSSLLERPLAFSLISLLLVTALTAVLFQLFTGRGAYIHVGALLGTLMAGNVFFVIIPAQRELVAALEEGREPDAGLGRYAALRSLHNNYMTLPVVFMMISSHFPFTYGQDSGWLVLVGIIIAGAVIRHWFNLRAREVANAWLLPGAAVVLLALVALTLPETGAAANREVTFEEGVAIIEARCAVCHSATPTQPGFTAPPKGVVFDTPELIVSQAAKIREMAVTAQIMPPGNITDITDDERAALAAWLDQYTDG
ncbi:MAG: urate hydroxylase PuuD [Acidimicrobiia bacterium]